MSDKYNETEASVSKILTTLWDIARGTAESLRLSAAERLTLLLSAIAVAALAAILGTAVIVFLSLGAARMLADVTPLGAYFIVAGFYALLLVLLVVFRRQLVTDPVCRLVTRLLVAPPDETDDAAELQSNPENTPDHGNGQS